MAANRIKIQDIIASQLPTYVREDFPLLGDFLQQYYLSQEIEGATYDLVQNLDQYVKVDELFQLTTETVLASNVRYTDRTITADVSGNFTYGFPETNGLIKIDDEIIFYDYKTDSTFEGCTRGFSGVTSYTEGDSPDQLVFQETEAGVHTAGATIYNLNILFLQEFFKKIKFQFAPGFTERDLYSGLDQRNFVFGLDSFYNSKGTDESFKILFQALYGVNVDVIRPSEFLLRPSNADYKVTFDFIVERIQGNPLNLKNLTLFQKSTGARGSVTDVIPIHYDQGQYYQISVDTGYDRDIDVQGTIFGEFKVGPKTKLLNTVGAGTTILDVDSTLSFPESGSLVSTDLDDNIINLTYSGKTNNQFLGVSGVNYQINDKTDIRLDDYSYAYIGNNQNDEIRVRIASSLREFVTDSPTYGFEPGDIAKIQSLGYLSQNETAKNWLYNVKTKWDVQDIQINDITEVTYRISTYDPQFFKPGYSFILRNKITGVEVTGLVTRTVSPNSFFARISEIVNTSLPYEIENQILTGNSTEYPVFNQYLANVQNIYSKFNGDALVASNSLARYSNIETNPYSRTKTFNGLFRFTTVINLPKHGFYNGQALYYSPGIIKTTTTTPDGVEIVTESESAFDGVAAGVYYVNRIDSDNINLARSKSDLFEGRYITLDGDVENNTLTYYPYFSLNVTPQSIYREITTPKKDSGNYVTESGYTGILINGVEIRNYKSTESIRYGEIQRIDVASGGDGYDIINPPVLHISDRIGVGATGTCSVTGSLEQIQIVDSGFDYQGTPTVTILGGNGKGAVARANMTPVPHEVEFISSGPFRTLNLTNNTIGFSTYHKFRDYESVVYDSRQQTGVGGLSTGSIYFVNVVDTTTVKLHTTASDANLGINTVSLTSVGNGIQAIRSTSYKRIVSNIIISDPGSGYSNNERNIPRTVGIQTSLNQFNIPNHGYKSKEIIKFTPTGNGVLGLSSTKEYYVNKVNDDSFTLSEVGVGSTAVDYFYNNQILVDVLTEGSGSFNYRPITVSVEGVTGVSTRTDQDFSCVVQPIFRGQITHIDVSNTGVGYGSSEIINFDRQPDITFVRGQDATVTPVISNGQIIEVIINSQGYGYNSPPNLIITSDTGNYAALTPITNSEGKLVDVKVIKGGIGYSPETTFITVVPAGQEARASAKIRNWTINLFRELLPNVNDDDGYILPNINSSSLQYAHLYAPRALRQSVYGVVGNDFDNTAYGTADLNTLNGSEIDSTIHSPIIGWAYDGNPIYGPYGFSNPNGSGAVRRMTSGYSASVRGNSLTIPLGNTPPLSLWPTGFFVEDYIFTGGGDLDQHNGRYCVTPDYPEGTYAYFVTINSTVDSSGPFSGFRAPVFPYVIGNSFHSRPNLFNFKSISNQVDYDVEGDGWFRETSSYNINKEKSGYDYIFDSSKIVTQYAEITSASTGSIESVDIVSGGSNYRINDPITVDISDSLGERPDIRVSSVSGKKIDTVSVATTEFFGVEFIPTNSIQKNSFIGFMDAPHNFLNEDIINISGLSTYYEGFGGSYSVGIRSDNFVLSLGVQTTGVTGIVTYFYVSGVFDNSHIRENDILTIEQEKVKVLNIDARTGRLRVRREEEGTTAAGYAYTSGGVLYEDPRKFYVNVGLIKTDKQFNLNKEIYFDPSESVAIGTVTGTGLGSTITFGNPGVGRTNIFIPPQQVYLPNHKLRINDKVYYATNGGTSIQIWNGISGTAYTSLTDFSPLYAVPFNENFVGFGTNRIGLSSTGGYVGVGADAGLVYFTSVGVGDTHSFTTDLNNIISGKISKNIVTVSTATTHSLQKNDTVTVNILPITTRTVVVKYDQYNRRIVFDPQDFVAGDIDTTFDTITFANNPFQFGDKVIHTSTSPTGGLVDEGIYYVIPFETNKIRLVSEKFELSSADPKFINLTNASAGTLSKINPAVRANRNNTIRFDVSDPSLSFSVNGITYPAYKLQFFIDSDYSQVFFATDGGSDLLVTRGGRPGIDSDAYVQLVINRKVPNALFYKFELDNISIITEQKKELIIDDDVPNYTQINLVPTAYDGPHIVTGIGSTTFTYNIPNTPETSIFNFDNSQPSYETSSKTEKGSITKFQINGPGYGYRSIPGFTSVRSAEGTGAIVELQSKNIGVILNNKLNEIGFDYPSDKTVRVVANLPELTTVESLTSFERIGIASQGRNYVVAPNLVVLDGLTGEIVQGLDLFYHLGDDEVTILSNATGMNNIPPRIIPINNPNGIGLGTASYDASTKTAKVYLSRSFSTGQESQFPFDVGTKLMIENISVGVGSTGSGYNSSDYGYTFFEITNYDLNLGGRGAYIEYSLDGIIPDGKVAGNVDARNSYGRAIDVDDLAIYNSVLKTNDYLIGENFITDSGKRGTVERWDPKTEKLVISVNEEINIGEKIIGRSSDTQSIVRSKVNFNSEITIGAGATVNDGWQTNSGFLNDNLQKLPNNEYYQNFSYSLNSTIPYQTWSDPVSALDHTAGFAKFADLDIISKEEQSSAIVQTFAAGVDLVVDVVGEASLNCEYDWDLVTEETVFVSNEVISKEIIFETRYLKDYNNSIGNRVLSVDDISGEFNSNERTTPYAPVASYEDNDVFNKIFTYVKDVKFTEERQFSVVSAIQKSGVGYLQEYATIENLAELGSFSILDTFAGWDLIFYPLQFEYSNYDVSSVSMSIVDNLGTEDTRNFGDIVLVSSATTTAAASATSTLVSISSTYRSAKVCVLIEVPESDYTGNEFNLVHDGTNVSMVAYGDMKSNEETFYSGIGTFNSYLSGGNIIVDFTPDSAITETVNTFSSVVAIADSTSSGTTDIETLESARVRTYYKEIPAETSPYAVTVASYDAPYASAYYLVGIEDLTNNNYELVEVGVLNNDDGEVFVTFGNVLTGGTGIGTIGVAQTTGTEVDLTFTPNANTEVQVRTYGMQLQVFDRNEQPQDINIGSIKIHSDSGTYSGTKLDLKTSFDVKHNGLHIFRRSFLGNDPSIANTYRNQVELPDHYFVSGEQLNYSHAGAGSTMAIGIALTTVPGIGLTDKLPPTLFAVNIGGRALKFASSPENALKVIPDVFEMTSVGIGTSHSISAINQNSKALITIDDMIQSPIARTPITSTLSGNIAYNLTLPVTGVTSFFAGDIIQIDDEIMTVKGVSRTDLTMNVQRAQMGTPLNSHANGATIRKLTGNYNITDSTINFVSAPYGNVPLSTTTGDPSYRDWTGITTSSRFHGRTFMRNAPFESLDETYSHNYVFDDISTQFTGITSHFILTSDFSNTVGYSTDNGIILINGIFQKPDRNVDETILEDDYEMNETSGITTITFRGTGVQDASDPNKTDLPTGGYITFVSSQEGFAYQPLVSAGGTANISGLGTVSSISIGNSGSGYRSGIQTVVNVGVQTYSGGIPNIEFIGTAAISGGHIVSIAITNPGAGYTTTNPPEVVFDAPLNYENIPLVYASGSSGVGTGAKINITVGQGSSVINYDLTRSGYGYEDADVLTVELGGTTGIPTDTTKTFSQFQLTVDDLYYDSFNGWTLGALQVYDSLDDQFDGEKRKFFLTIGGVDTSIDTFNGSPIELDQTLLVFINNILQVPGEGYIFNRGGRILFAEPPQIGDTSKILFYRGTEGVDVKFVEIIDNVKKGDDLRINNDPLNDQTIALDQEFRTAFEVRTSDLATTNPYIRPGVTQDTNLTRPVIWCRQTTDRIIDGVDVGKDRENYEPNVYPATYILNDVGIGSTGVYVSNIRPLFDQYNEGEFTETYTDISAYQKKIYLTSQDTLTAAAATAIVSTAGTISSFDVTTAGLGYTSAPEITVANPVGLGTTQRATGTAVLSGSTIGSISVSSPGTGYTDTNPPQVLIAPPRLINEDIGVSTYKGDFGTIVGVGTTTSGSQSQFYFDTYIPQGSVMRDISYVGTAVTVSGISTGDYLVVLNTNLSIGGTFASQDTTGTKIGIATTALDCVYQVTTFEDNDQIIHEGSLVGFTTTLRRIFVNVDNAGSIGYTTAPYMGDFSWGKIMFKTRIGAQPFNFYGDNGYSGISTSGLVTRLNPLRSVGYTTV
jgi:hypothetical protein